MTVQNLANLVLVTGLLASAVACQNVDQPTRPSALPTTVGQPAADSSLAIVPSVTVVTRCAPTVTPNAVAIGNGGGTAVLTVNAGSICNWTATAGPSWISMSPGAGKGSGTLTLRISGNAAAARTATLAIAGTSVTVSQAAAVNQPPPPTCGAAAEVTSRVKIDPSSLTAVDPYMKLQRQSIRISNNSAAILPGPLYLVFSGLPTADVYVSGSPSLTTCFSSRGDTIVLLTAGGLAPGQDTGFIALFGRKEIYNAIKYTPRVLTGRPPLK